MTSISGVSQHVVVVDGAHSGVGLIIELDRRDGLGNAAPPFALTTSPPPWLTRRQSCGPPPCSLEITARPLVTPYRAQCTAAMRSWGSFELARRRAQEREQRRKPTPIKTILAPGSMEWFAEQEKARSNAAPAPVPHPSPDIE